MYKKYATREKNMDDMIAFEDWEIDSISGVEKGGGK